MWLTSRFGSFDTGRSAITRWTAAGESFVANYRREDERQTIEVRFEVIDGDSLSYVVAVVHDVTERIRQETRLVNAHLELEHQNQMRQVQEIVSDQLETLAAQEGRELRACLRCNP